MALEVIWPRHKWDYLTVLDPDMPVNPPPLTSTWSEPERSASAAFAIRRDPVRRAANGTGASQQEPSSSQPERSDPQRNATARQGRAVAVHAYMLGAQCGERRTGELLGVSRRTVGRDRAYSPMTTLPILEVAQTLIGASVDRGSTPEERAAAAAWLTAGATPETVGSPAGAGQTPATKRAPKSQSEHRSFCEAANDAHTVGGHDAPRAAAACTEISVSSDDPTPVSWTRDQVDACSRLHRRIRVRTDAIRRLLEPEMQRDDLVEVVLELLGEIRGATEALETLLRPRGI